ncbi:putative AMP-dependent synthetase/ligase, AMP-binding, AMP-binding enzyme domain, ANL [Dioscorea sansibarensis]
MATVESELLSQLDHDKRSGFCRHTGTYRSLHHLPLDPNPSEVSNVAAFVLSNLLNVADEKPALIDVATGRVLTYYHLRRSVLSLATALRSLGLRPGNIVLLLSPNSILYPVVTLGILVTGAAVSPANPVNTPAEIEKQALDSGAVLAISAPDLAHKLASLSIPILLTTRSPSDESALSAEELIEGTDPDGVPSQSMASDVAALLYSSGTTGASKGVKLTHANLIATLKLLKWTVDVSSARDDVYLGFLPMSHVYGLAFFALGLPYVGVTTVVMSRFELRAAMEAVERFKISSIPAVPPVLVAMLKDDGEIKLDLSSLRRMITGAAALAPATGREFRRRFPWVQLRQGYGLTESSGAATYFAVSEEAKKREGAVGRLLPWFEARVVDVASGERVGPGEEGELWLKGPTVMAGYLRNDVATFETLDRDGWLRTGDLVFIDEDGFVYIVDRVKELIKHNGYQVAPAELEAVLVRHTDILDAAVVPMEDEEAGQIPAAFVVKSAGSELTSEHVIQFVASQVAPYKKIRRVEFITAIPRSLAGKILRKQLVALFKQAPHSKL